MCFCHLSVEILKLQLCTVESGHGIDHCPGPGSSDASCMRTRMILTFSVRDHNSSLSVIRRNGTARTTVTPLTLATLVVSSVIHLSGAPGLQSENILNFGRLAVKQNENKLQMLIKHWIKHVRMMIELPTAQCQNQDIKIQIYSA